MLCGASDAHIILQYVDHAYLLPAFVLTVCRDDATETVLKFKCQTFF